MIQLSQIKCRIPHTEAVLRKKAAARLRIRPEEITSLRILQRSVDARKKDQLAYVYTLGIETGKEQKILKANRDGNISLYKEKKYVFPAAGPRLLEAPPVVVGSGPAGLFCAYELAKAGYQPLLLERGDPVEVRREKVDRFWETGHLDPESNVQFGEGGAGTFSDGKLNTGIKDKDGRLAEIMRIFTAMGAPEEILYDTRRHIGTDRLALVVKNLREEILRLGGTVRFRCKVTGLRQEKGQLTRLLLSDGEEIPASVAVFAIGHSARDTFRMLYEEGLSMEAKAFAVGLRAEHPADLITEQQYGADAPEELGAANYKLTTHTSDGRGVYTFCMCPGGYVVNASSEEGMLAVNGMSYQARNGSHSNSAVVVTVQPEDFSSYTEEDTPAALSGIAFQRDLEQKAYQLAGGAVPVQRFEDFCRNRTGGAGLYQPQIKGRYAFANVRSILPETLAASLEEGIHNFNRRLEGFASPECLLSGVESRTSSPVRILRDGGLESSLKGLYPCGEGAGYAGGITSAAADGMRVAEAIAQKYYR